MFLTSPLIDQAITLRTSKQLPDAKDRGVRSEVPFAQRPAFAPRSCDALRALRLAVLRHAESGF
jgi:hypothetical protein